MVVQAQPIDGKQLRKDARRNREAILDAARKLFAESTDVAMCEVARRAGVGQATLYRNFPDRAALEAAIFDEHLDRIARIAKEHQGDADAFFVLLRSIVADMVQLCALGELAREDACLGSRLERERRRIAELLRGPLHDAKQAGALRRDASLDDVFLVLLMAKGAMENAHGIADRAAAASRVLTLALDGLVASGAAA